LGSCEPRDRRGPQPRMQWPVDRQSLNAKFVGQSSRDPASVIRHQLAPRPGSRGYLPGPAAAFVEGVIVEGRRHRNFIILAPTPTPNWRRRHKIGFVISIKPIWRGRHHGFPLTPMTGSGQIGQRPGPSGAGRSTTFRRRLCTVQEWDSYEAARVAAGAVCPGPSQGLVAWHRAEARCAAPTSPTRRGD